jgi:peptidylprolyl isomerase
MFKVITSIILLAVIIGGIIWWMNRKTTIEPIVGIKGINTEAVDLYGTNQKKYMNATLHTTKGDITIEFNPDTPNTVQNFSKLAESKFYDGVKFHRVIKGFMIQGGDPLTKDDSQAQKWGTGGPGYNFNDEISTSNKNNIGTISMANAGPNTNGSQFFINLTNNNFLDTKHTVFGKVTAGMDVVEAIGMSPVDRNDRPQEPISITSVSLK